MRALGYHRRQRKADMQRLNTVETELAEVVRMAGPLPAMNSRPAAGSAAPAAPDRGKQQARVYGLGVAAVAMQAKR
jgi:hypothetical protein